MRRLVRLLVVAVLLLAPAAAAQDGGRRAGPGPRQQLAQLSLDDLFARLAVSPEPVSAKALEAEILRRLHQSGSATIDLLLARAVEAMQQDDKPLALDLLDHVVTLKPDFAEGWNKRATVHFLRKDYGKAVADLERVLILQPRHFGALAGLGIILKEIGDDDTALEVFEQALKVHPQMEDAREAREELERGAVGRAL